MNPDEYIQQRLQDQIDWYDRKSLENQRTYKRLRMVEIIAAALVPLLSGVAASTPDFARLSTLLVAVLGTVVTVIASVLNFGQHQQHWIEYRATCESLKREKFLFQTGAEPYGGPDAFRLLVQSVEALVSKENASWTQYMLKPERQSQQQQKPA